MFLVGFWFDLKAAFKMSNCLDLMVVRGPRRLPVVVLTWKESYVNFKPLYRSEVDLMHQFGIADNFR